MNKKYEYRGLFLKLTAFCVLLIASCKQIEVFEKNAIIPNHEWHSHLTVKGSFEIKDTINKYNIYLVLRHTDAYQYNNIWLSIGLQSPGDSMFKQKTDLTLGNDANGWEGTGMDDIWELRKLLTGEPRRFKKTGLYNYSIEQIMRDDPLRHIMNVGVRVEKEKSL